MATTSAPSGPSTGQSVGLNERLLFWASFFTLIAAGIGFSVRGFILKDWGNQFGFTQTELGGISGGGLVGFGVAIIFFSFFADRFGYGKLMLVAFLLHSLSAVVTFAATPIWNATQDKNLVFTCLNSGMWLFALGNGTCEAVINPLTASLFPRNKTHWLNILHAGWPLGLILGAVVGLVFKQIPGTFPWEAKLGVFLIPVLMYGVMMLNRPFPKSEAKASGVSTGNMLVALLAPLLFFLFLLHALVGYVELGTDGWITNITTRVLDNETYALLAFIWTNLLMFVLRFFAGPIVHRINPLGLLLGSALLGTLGLFLLGQPFTNTVWLWVGAVTIYGIGKTFYWPTLLGVISERFPKAGALALGISGGIGMLSAGLLGTPGIGYKQDLAGVEKLKGESEATYLRYAARDDKGELKADGFPVVTSIMPNLAPPVAGLDNGKLKVFDDFKGGVIRAYQAQKAGKPETAPYFLSETIKGDQKVKLVIDGGEQEVALRYLTNTQWAELEEKAKADKKDPPAVHRTGLQDDLATIAKEKAANKPVEKKLEDNLTSQQKWWDEVGQPNFSVDENKLDTARVYGAKTALLWTSAVPAALAVGFLLLLLFFMMQGGYKQVHLDDHAGNAENATPQ
jgi:MFS family permease